MRIEEVVENLCQVSQISSSVFELHVDPACTARFDSGHFEQVLWNLCLNALRYSQKLPGSVRLRAFTADDGRVTLEVSDDGTGVPGDAVQKLFEPFFTTDASGTGLGLYIARELCEANGAMIEYKRAIDGGACFRIIFRGDDES